jgi:hypothetical protein
MNFMSDSYHSLHHIFLQFRETERHFSYVRHQRNEKSKLDLTLSDRFRCIMGKKNYEDATTPYLLSQKT